MNDNKPCDFEGDQYFEIRIYNKALLHFIFLIENRSEFYEHYIKLTRITNATFIFSLIEIVYE